LQRLQPVIYQVQLDNEEKRTLLDPNHTHFFLVDDGTEHMYGRVTEFRAALEEKISKRCLNDGMYKITSFSQKPT